MSKRASKEGPPLAESDDAGSGGPARTKLGDSMVKHDLAQIRQTTSAALAKPALMSTGLFWLDYMSGSFEGLFPKPALIEVAALKGVGKTTLCLHAIGYNQMLAKKAGTRFNVLYLDWEKNLLQQQELAIALGADFTDPGFHYRQPRTFEGGYQFLIECLKPHTRKLWLGLDEPLDFIVCDTLAAARPKCEIDNKLGNTNKPGYRGKLAAEAFRNIQGDLEGVTGPAVVVINHLQQQIDMNATSYGPPKYDSPGSNALKLYAAQRYFMKRLDARDYLRDVTDQFTYETTKQIYAMAAEFECEKSKVGKPFAKTSYMLRPGAGIDAVLTMFETAARKPGALYTVNNANFGVPAALGGDRDSCPATFQGRFKFLDHLLDSRRDSKQLAKNLNELWEQQMEVYWDMRDRIAELQKEAKALDPALPHEISQEDDLTSALEDVAGDAAAADI